MIGKKGPELVRPVGKHEKDVWDKSQLLLHGEDTVSDVFGHVDEIWDGEAADGKCVSHDFGVLWLRVANWPMIRPFTTLAATAAAKRIGAELRIRCRADLAFGL